MIRTPSPSIVMVHQAVLPYRRPLFQLIDAALDVRFLFVGYGDLNRRTLPDAGLSNWRILADRRVPPYSAGVSAALVRLAARSEYDVWVTSTTNWFPTHAAFPIVKARRRAFVLFTEDWWWPNARGDQLIRPYDRVIFRGSDAIIATGSRVQEFVEANGARPEKVVVAHNAIDGLGGKTVADSDVTDARHALAGPGAEFVFLFLNRMVDYKGLDVLIEAFAGIAAAGVTLVVAGDGPERGRCEALARARAPGRVRFVGTIPHERVHLAYLACDVYVHPARFLPKSRVRAEAWGFTVNEAMSVGKPVVATTAVAAAFDLVEDGVTGFLAPHDDVVGLRRQLERAVANRDRLPGMGRAAQAKVSLLSARAQADGFGRAVELSLSSGRQGVIKRRP